MARPPLPRRAPPLVGLVGVRVEVQVPHHQPVPGWRYPMGRKRGGEAPLTFPRSRYHRKVAPPMMSRKYYKAIAAAISQHTCFDRLGADNDTPVRVVINKDALVAELAWIFTHDNPRFDSGTFKEACR